MAGNRQWPRCGGATWHYSFVPWRVVRLAGCARRNDFAGGGAVDGVGPPGQRLVCYGALYPAGAPLSDALGPDEDVRDALRPVAALSVPAGATTGRVPWRWRSRAQQCARASAIAFSARLRWRVRGVGAGVGSWIECCLIFVVPDFFDSLSQKATCLIGRTAHGYRLAIPTKRK